MFPGRHEGGVASVKSVGDTAVQGRFHQYELRKLRESK